MLFVVSSVFAVFVRTVSGVSGDGDSAVEGTEVRSAVQHHKTKENQPRRFLAAGMMDKPGSMTIFNIVIL